MTLQLLNPEFLYIWGNFDFLFYQCTPQYTYIMLQCDVCLNKVKRYSYRQKKLFATFINN
jgi:hypothetical protein